MELVTVRIPTPYLDKMEELIIKDLYPNRAEIIRTAIRELLKQEFYYEQKKRLIELEQNLGITQ